MLASTKNFVNFVYKLNLSIKNTRLRNNLGSFKRLLKGAFLKNPLREFRIKATQRALVIEHYSPDVKRLIVFLTPGFDYSTGGILSISSLYNEASKLKHIHGAEVMMCTLPGDPLLPKYTKFKNNNYMFSFFDIFSYFRNIESLLIHIPEDSVSQFVKKCSINDYRRSRKINDLRINIMLQNIDLMPSSEDVTELHKLGNVTCTTAHDRYSTPEVAERIGCALHKFSVYVSPEQYSKKPYSGKDNLMVVSPDLHSVKSKVISLLLKNFPKLQIQIIRNLSYEEYKIVISRAKWALTFGEGLDGYFVETIFSGGISFAVYNERFFTEDFKSLKTVYPSYEVLLERIVSDINELNDEVNYSEYQSKQCYACAKRYNYKRYKGNIASFYRKYFSAGVR